MKVIYAIGSRFAGGGTGTTAYYAACGLHRHKLLHRLLCGSFRPTEIPREKIKALGLPSRVLRKLAVFDRSQWLHYLDSLIFDIWASRLLAPADLFHVWGNFGLRSLQRAKAMGMITVIERASSHPLYQARLLQEEYAHWGLDFRIPPANLRRASAELQLADYVLIPSDFVRQSFFQENFPENRLLQVSFGADITRFQPAERPGSHLFRVLFVGHIGIRKGVPYLLEAWRQLGWRDAELILVGRVDTRCKALLSRWQGLPGVKMMGHVPDPVSLYQQADVFAFPTIEEGSALVTFEALACGLPVITTPNAGSVIRDEIEGFLLPVRDVDGIAERLERLRADAQLRYDMGNAARRRAEVFTWQAYGDNLARLYQQVVLDSTTFHGHNDI